MDVTFFKRNGSRNWQARWRDEGGRDVRRSTGQAELPFDPPPQLNFDHAADHFFAHHPMADTTRRGYLASYCRWLDHLGGRRGLREITPDDISSFVAKRTGAGTGSPAIRQDIAFLSSLLTYSQLLPGGPERNVARDYPTRSLAPPASRERFLSRAEAKTLLAALKEGPQRSIVELVLETGMRRSEVLPLRKQEVRLDEGVIYLAPERTKTRKGRYIPLSNRARDILRSLKPKGEWVFANSKTGKPFYDPQPWFPKAVNDAALGDFHFHDLRHTFASWFLQRRGKITTLQEILGHRSIQTTRRYSHLDPNHVRDEFLRVWNSDP